MMKHSQFKTFSQPCSNKTFSNGFSHNTPTRGWPYKFFPRGTTGSSILDHDFGHLCFGRRIQISGHSDFRIVKTCVLADTASAAWPEHPGSLDIMYMTFAAVIWTLTILVRWILRTHQNHLLQRHLWVRPCLLYFWCFASNSAFFKMTDVHQWGGMNFCALRPCFINHLFLASDFVSCHAGTFSIFPIISPLPPLHPVILMLEASEWICEQDCYNS